MIILYPLSLIYGFFVFIRESLYKMGILKSYNVKTKVLSVGNLTFGGTGKTPVVDFLLENLKNQKKIAVISRGYGRSSKGFYEVQLDSVRPAKMYGDEPVLLKTRHPDVPIYVCEDRVAGIRKIESNTQFDLIIADDAFQHLKLKRDVDIVVLDATENPKNYNYPPVGRARNSLQYLKRADIVFLTKTNWAAKERVEKIKNKVTKNFIEFESRIEKLVDLQSAETLANDNIDVFLISGIGKPLNFEKALMDVFPGFKIRKHFIFKDHHDFTDSDLLNVKNEVGTNIVITTEKDAVKLKNFKLDMPVYVAQLKTINTQPMETVYELLN
jgi:tetraacyldisaccharide 4'-kinase